MKNIGTLYQDHENRVWLLKKLSLPKKKGAYSFWTAALIDGFTFGNKEFREDIKRDLLIKIINL